MSDVRHRGVRSGLATLGRWFHTYVVVPVLIAVTTAAVVLASLLVVRSQGLMVVTTEALVGLLLACMTLVVLMASLWRSSVRRSLGSAGASNERILRAIRAERLRRVSSARDRNRQLDFDAVDAMDGTGFEHYVGTLLAFQGFSIQHTGKPGDQGCDLVATRDGVRYAVQTKRSRDPVSNAAVQQAVTAVAHYRCTHAMVVTNSRFNRGARDLAASNGCRLIGRRELGGLADDRKNGVRSGIL